MIDTIKEKYNELTEDKTLGWWFALAVVTIMGGLIIFVVLWNVPELIVIGGTFLVFWFLWVCIHRIIDDKWYWE